MLLTLLVIVEMASASVLLLQEGVQVSFHALGGVYIAAVIGLTAMVTASCTGRLPWGATRSVLAAMAALAFVTLVLAGSVHIHNGEYLILLCGAQIITTATAFVVDVIQLAAAQPINMDDL